jgi:hypothetical protein
MQECNPSAEPPVECGSASHPGPGEPRSGLPPQSMAQSDKLIQHPAEGRHLPSARPSTSRRFRFHPQILLQSRQNSVTLAIEEAVEDADLAISWLKQRNLSG